jgi:hypothetical protein
VRLVASDAESKEVEVDLVMSPLIDEPLISDILAGRLEIAVEDFAEGLWRFKWEPIEKLEEARRELSRLHVSIATTPFTNLSVYLDVIYCSTLICY